MDRPILFSGEMVKAILEGRKTQTRRVIKPQPETVMDGEIDCAGNQCGYSWVLSWKGHELSPWRDCPYGNPGDVLWVRETWTDLRGMGFGNDPNTDKPWHYAYAADIKPGSDKEYGVKWRPSIHMPREAARLFLRVKRVRVERLQDIMPDDVLREGLWDVGTETAALDAFAELWNSIYAKRGYGWNTNPWVWVVEFEQRDANV